MLVTTASNYRIQKCDQQKKKLLEVFTMSLQFNFSAQAFVVADVDVNRDSSDPQCKFCSLCVSQLRPS